MPNCVIETGSSISSISMGEHTVLKRKIWVKQWAVGGPQHARDNICAVGFPTRFLRIPPLIVWSDSLLAGYRAHGPSSSLLSQETRCPGRYRLENFASGSTDSRSWLWNVIQALPALRIFSVSLFLARERSTCLPIRGVRDGGDIKPPEPIQCGKGGNDVSWYGPVHRQ